MADRLSILIHRQKGLCKYCQRPFANGGRYRATEDHVIPKSRGGTGAWRNIVAACSWCNTRKGSLTVAEFMAKLPALMAVAEMVKRQRKAIRRQQHLARFENIEFGRKKDMLKAVEADLRYAAKSTAWAEPLAALLASADGPGVQANSNLIREPDVDPSNPLSSGSD